MTKKLGFQQISKHFLQEEAKKRWYIIETIDEKKNVFFIKNKNKEVLFKGIDGGFTTRNGKYLSEDKLLTYKLLQRNNINIPPCLVIHKRQKIDLSAAIELGFPLVSKPLNWTLWRWVVVWIQDEEDLEKAIKYGFEFDRNIIVQKQVEGENHKVFACLKWERHHIIWNGKDTIRELLEKENLNPLRGENVLVFTLPKIDISQELEDFFIAQYGYSLNSCPKKDEILFLKGNWYSKVIDFTDEIPQEIKEKCEEVSTIFNLKVTGVDVIYNTLPSGDIEYWILEANSQAWIKTHHMPMEGKPRNVAWAILDLYFTE